MSTVLTAIVAGIPRCLIRTATTSAGTVVGGSLAGFCILPARATGTEMLSRIWSFPWTNSSRRWLECAMFVTLRRRSDVIRVMAMDRFQVFWGEICGNRNGFNLLHSE